VLSVLNPCLVVETIILYFNVVFYSDVPKETSFIKITFFFIFIIYHYY